MAFSIVNVFGMQAYTATSGFFPLSLRCLWMAVLAGSAVRWSRVRPDKEFVARFIHEIE